MACRDATRCADAKRELDARQQAGGGTVGSCECATLDLAQPESIRSFAQQFSKRKERLSLLVNNAGSGHVRCLHPTLHSLLLGAETP